MADDARVLLLEPFHDGSHAAFVDVLTEVVPVDWTVWTLPGRHWKWRMRGSAVHFAQRFASEGEPNFDLLLATSFVPLAELFGLAPALSQVPALLYFHENQLTYPNRQNEARDHHFGMTQLVSARAATRLLFNSETNRRAFLDAGAELLRRMPDAVPTGWIDGLWAKSEVMPVPMRLPELDVARLEAEPSRARPEDGPLLLWNHRWEYDKGPEVLAAALQVLMETGLPFRLALCGQRFRKVPPELAALRNRLGPRLVTADYLPRPEYEALLLQADIAISTARQEFFGLSMLEATHFGARPLVPDALVYPELYPVEFRHAPGALASTLAALVQRWHRGERLRSDRRPLTARFGARTHRAWADLIAAAGHGGSRPRVSEREGEGEPGRKAKLGLRVVPPEELAQLG